MNTAMQTAYFKALEKRLAKMELETRLMPSSDQPGVGQTMRFLLPISDDGDSVLVEVTAATIDEELGFFQFYTTMLIDLKEPLDALREKIHQWNFVCPFGSFGIFEQEGHLYHKYALPVFSDEKKDPEVLVQETISILSVLYDIIGEQYYIAAEMLHAER